MKKRVIVFSLLKIAELIGFGMAYYGLCHLGMFIDKCSGSSIENPNWYYWEYITITVFVILILLLAVLILGLLVVGIKSWLKSNWELSGKITTKKWKRK